MKGYIYTLEALLAVSIVLLSMTVVFKQTPDYSAAADLTKFHSSSSIRYIADMGYIDGSEDEIAYHLENSLPSNIDFSVDICSPECAPGKNLPEKNIVVIDYYTLKDGVPHKIRFWLWEK